MVFFLRWVSMLKNNKAKHAKQETEVTEKREIMLSGERI